MTPALETQGLGRRYGSQWALQGCTLEIPRGTVTALVGPNGAGKTTLLRLAVGLTRPSAGSVRVFGLDPHEQAAEALPRVGFLAQEHPLYGGFSIEEMLRVGRELNPGWDDEAAHARIAELGLPLEKKVRTLSGGQRAQVALTIALAKRPELLLLDEPVASLDPLARREFMQSILEAVAERELTVVLSSHILADLERVCDHLVILATGRTQLVGSIDEMLRVGRELNPGWDDDAARDRISELDLPLKKKVRSLSGGQRAQVALTLALAKRPELLLLDEPVASLDPLARREFMQSVVEAVAERELTVVLSSHILADLERVCDHLVILATGRTQLVGSIDEIVAGHRLLTGPRDAAEDVTRMHDIVRESHADRQTTLLVRANGHIYDSRWTVHELDLEEIVLAYLGQDAARRREAVLS